MKTYTFGDVTKTLKKNTFALEETVKDAVGASQQNEQKLISINKEFKQLSEELTRKGNGKPTTKRKRQIVDRMDELNAEVIALQERIRWSMKLETCLEVMDILLVEGSAGLNKENFGRFDAEKVWSDFFTAPTESETE